MKLIYYIVLYTLSLSCITQKTTTILNNNNMQYPEYNIPIITNKFEVFDIEIFNKEVNIISKKRVIQNDLIYLEENYQKPGYIRRIYENESFFMISKFFYDNGNIKSKIISFNNGSPYGIWYEFNEEGKLIKETDYNQPKNKIGWRYILRYCNKNNIPLTKGYKEFSGFQTTIYLDKDVEKEQGIWTITWQIAGDKLKEIKLHGFSARIISEKELEFINP